MIEDKTVTVEELYHALKKLVEKGKGDLPVFIAYEGVFGHARRVEVVTRAKYNKGVFIGD